LSFKLAKIFARSLPMPKTNRSLLDNVLSLNKDLSAQERRRKPKILFIELPGNEDSVSVIEYSLWRL
jgi:hypothetical protein